MIVLHTVRDTIEHVPFRLDEILSNLSTVVGIRAQEKGLELIFDVENGLPETLVGDPLRLNQVLVNLCGNSVKFTEKGEIILQIRCLHRVADSLRIEITVSDTGIGMSPEQMNRLFHAFTQADTSTTRKYGGTGLGLSISNRLVQMLDGSFDVQSAEGTGSTFVFTAVFGIAKTDKPRRRAAAVSFTGIRALVTDDNESARIVLCDQLESLGFTVTSAKSGTEALQIIETAHQERNPFTLVLMDWLMPGLDGLEAAKRIRSFPDFGPKIKIILATAFGHDDIFREARASGFDCFLVKPVSLSAMHDAVMNVLGKQARRRGRGVRKRDPYSAVRHIRGARILLVEDNEMNRQVAVELLEDAGFSVTTAWNGKQAVEKMNRTFHAVLMDIQMPVMDGFEATHRIRSRREFDGIPIVAMTANAMEHDKKAALAAGMVDHVAKPIDPARLFSTLAETRDNDTGNHIRRTQYYIKLLAERLRNHPHFSEYLTPGTIDLLFKSAPLHDIGKVGIPDKILLKPGRFEPEEFDIMKTHAVLGKNAIERAEKSLGMPVEFLSLAKEIALSHHEKWDGSGYPHGVTGEDIPICARLMALADVYDALISRRVYKTGMSHEEAERIIEEGRSTHFDPDIVDAFLTIRDEFRKIAKRFIE